jgi:bacterioferritin-associated ferredoxin
MYICLCNALTDQDIRQAVLDGAERPSEVYRACGRRLQCGCCSRTIQSIITETRHHHVRASASIPE